MFNNKPCNFTFILKLLPHTLRSIKKGNPNFPLTKWTLDLTNAKWRWQESFSFHSHFFGKTILMTFSSCRKGQIFAISNTLSLPSSYVRKRMCTVFNHSFFYNKTLKYDFVVFKNLKKALVMCNVFFPRIFEKLKYIAQKSCSTLALSSYLFFLVGVVSVCFAYFVVFS